MWRLLGSLSPGASRRPEYDLFASENVPAAFQADYPPAYHCAHRMYSRNKHGVGGFVVMVYKKYPRESFTLGLPGTPFILVTVIPVETRMRDIRGISIDRQRCPV